MQPNPTLIPPETPTAQEKLYGTASMLGREVVDIGGFLENLTEQCNEQLIALEALRFGSNSIVEANSEVLNGIEDVASIAENTLASVRTSVSYVTETSESSLELAGWVRAIHEKSSAIEDMLSAVRKSNDQIASIAAQVNVLAMNAKIEAARAGTAGKGFAIVAEAINDLSYKTTQAAEEISSSIQNMANWMSQLQQGAEVTALRAETLLERGQESDKALHSIETLVTESHTATQSISQKVHSADQAIKRFIPSLTQIGESINVITEGVESTSGRVENLISQSESIIQNVVSEGEVQSIDHQLISIVQDLAARVAHEFENAIEAGWLSEKELFDTAYTPIEDTNPQQHMAKFTRVTDRMLPPIQEPALALDPRIIFCAAVDRNGYLPTHNTKFSKRQSTDSAWNNAHCRNRRIFNDRVGLKAGQNEQPFLMQVYRRDMGGGAYALMRDLSAPIFVKGRHWGGLRIGYAF